MPAVSPGKHQLSTIARLSGVGQTTLKELILELSEQEVGQLTNSAVKFERDSRLKLAIVAISLGCPAIDVSRLLDWRDFENFAAEILRRNDYDVETNLLIKRPRMQIDLVARKGDFALCVDCKHWSRLVGPARITEVALRQLRRTRTFVESYPALKLGISNATTVVITLFEESIIMCKGVPVVPVDKFQRFITDLPAYVVEESLVKRTRSLK